MDGYRAGNANALGRIGDAMSLGITELTLFLFSNENWQRPADEVDGLMSLAVTRIANDTPQLDREGVHMRFIGCPDRVPSDVVYQMRWAETLTAKNTKLKLFLAFNYGGRQEIEEAARRRAASGSTSALQEHLYAPDMHDPDLLIRTGGDKRLSNFMLWQLAYTELVFRDEYWPDFTRERFEECLAEFATRRRRFGGG